MIAAVIATAVVVTMGSIAVIEMVPVSKTDSRSKTSDNSNRYRNRHSFFVMHSIAHNVTVMFRSSVYGRWRLRNQSSSSRLLLLLPLHVDAGHVLTRNSLEEEEEDDEEVVDLAEEHG